MKRFWTRYAWLYVPGLILLGVSSWLQTLVPRLLGEIIDRLNRIQAEYDPAQIGRALLLLLATAASVFVSRFAWRYLIMGNSRYLENALRDDLFEQLTRLPPAFYQNHKTGDLMAYAINDIGAIRMTLGPGLALSANAVVMGALSITEMSVGVDPQLTWLALIPVPVVLIGLLILGRFVQRRFRKVQEAFAAVSDRVQESISGLHVIKAHSREEQEQSRFEVVNLYSRDTQMRMTAVSAATGPWVSLLFGASFTIGLIYGSRLVLDGTISLGAFVAFQGYLALIVGPVQSVARIINLLQRGAASWKRYQAIMREIPTIRDTAETLPLSALPDKAAGDLRIDHLTFTYPGQAKPALSDLSLELRPGRRVGIFGRTGSGKSTLAALLVRQLDVPPGTITLDGRDILTLPLAWLRRQVALVPQDNFLFSATIDENIRFFDPRFSREEVEQASRAADLHDTVTEFPEGYATVVGERGVTLSGGQKQRVGLARALVRQAPVLLIDDTLSAVDTETERRILKALDAEAEGRAFLIIANRISALQDCDEIIVLENGRVAERGSHEQLTAAGGLYSRIAARQARDAEQT